MRVFYEKLIDSIEQYYGSKSTIENKLYIGDIVKDVINNSYIQYKNKINKTISYEYSDININGLIANKNSKYYFKQYPTQVLNFLNIENGKDNILKIEVINNHPTSGNPYKIKIYFNNQEIEIIEYNDLYTINNYKYVNFQSNKLNTNIKLTWPLFLNNGEFVEYKIYNISLNDNGILNKYMAIQDEFNRNIIFDREYKNNEINVVLRSYGSILRASDLNELYKINANSFVQFDNVRDKLIIPMNQLFKKGDSLKFILAQDLDINLNELEVGYNLLGIYLRDDHFLSYDIILSNVSYANLISNIDNYMLDVEKKTRDYLGFIIGLNNISDFVPIDLFLYNIGTGGGGGSGNANKISIDFTDVNEITIAYGSGSSVAPMIQVQAYDTDNSFNVITPESINYNLNDTITIILGDILTGKVEII